MELPTSTLLSLIFNFTIICVLLFISLLVYRDAKKHDISTSSALLWAIVSLFTFPIGLVLYVLFGKNDKNKNTQDRTGSNIN